MSRKSSWTDKQRIPPLRVTPQRPPNTDPNWTKTCENCGAGNW